MGLNGVEVLTPDGSRLNLAHATATADPIGVCALPGMATDARRVEQLLLGGESQWGWLAPFTPGTSCWVEIRLPEAVALGAVRLFNYAKTPSRGVREFQLLLDGAIIFGGVLRAAPLGNGGAVSGERPDFVQTVLFTSNQVGLSYARGVGVLCGCCGGGIAWSDTILSTWNPVGRSCARVGVLFGCGGAGVYLGRYC